MMETSFKLNISKALVFCMPSIRSTHEAFMFYLSLVQAAANRQRDNDLSSESHCLRSSADADVYLLHSQIGDTIFSNFICFPSLPFGRERTNTAIPAQASLGTSSRFILSSTFLHFFRSYIPRETVRVIVIQNPSVSGFFI